MWIVNTLDAADLLERRRRGVAPVGDELAGALREEERRVALVEVPDRRGEPERPDRADAADAEDQLLVEAHLAAPDVEDVGDRPVRGRVLRDVGVEQEDRDPADLGDPDRDGQVAIGQRHRDQERRRRRRRLPAGAAGG